MSRSAEGPPSSPRKGRALRLQPLPAVSAPISAAGALRDDPLQTQLAGLGEHDRALGRQGFAEQDAVDAEDEPRQRVAPLLERPEAQIVALKASCCL